MPRIPEPDMTANGPSYEGRALTRPDEEVVDQGAAFDLGTLVSRRGILSMIGVGAGALVLAACTPSSSGSSSLPSASATSSAGASTLVEIPDETAGPYPGDGSNGPDILEQSGIVRSDIRSSLNGGTTAAGVPLTFTLRVLDLANGGAPFAGVAVYAWHCDAEGRYSMYSSGVENETYLRGVQIADAQGEVTFTSVFPGCYSGRWPHIHFEVYPDQASITDSSNAIATSQLAMDEKSLNAVYALSTYPNSAQNLARITLDSDNVFGEDGGALQLATTTGSVSGGYRSTLDVGVDTATQPAAGGAGGGPGGAPGGEPGGGSGGGPGGGGTPPAAP